MFNKRDIVVVHFPFSDNSQSKLRPALVISSDKVNKTGDTIIVQITSKRKTDGLNPEMADTDLTEPLPLKSFIRCHKIFVIQNKLIIKKISEINKTRYDDFVSKVTVLIK